MLLIMQWQFSQIYMVNGKGSQISSSKIIFCELYFHLRKLFLSEMQMGGNAVVNIMGMLITAGTYWLQELYQTCWGIHLVSFIGEKAILWISSREIANELSEIKNGSQYGCSLIWGKDCLLHTKCENMRHWQ